MTLMACYGCPDCRLDYDGDAGDARADVHDSAVDANRGDSARPDAASDASDASLDAADASNDADADAD